MSNRAKVFGGVIVAIGAIFGFLKMTEQAEPSQNEAGRELSRAELELREGEILFVKGEENPFSGKIVDFFSKDQRRSEIEVQAGKPHGVSKGWYENGQLEVEEHYVEGISHGSRTRWYQSGIKKSEASIVEGKIEGVFQKWHENGRKAAKVTMQNGKAHGTSEGWHVSGDLKSRVVLEEGEVISREFFEDQKLSQK